METTMDVMKKSKKLSWLLRHGACEARVPMDAAGWVPIPAVLAYLHMSRAQLDQVARENNKSRLELVGDRVRCSQGHSTDNMPVTQEALEASWQRVERTEPLVHGTSVGAVAGIAVQGVQPMRRTHVHLADSASSKVGKRANIGVLLHVDPARLPGLWVSQNGVYLTRFVPPEAIVDVELVTRAARAAEAEVRALLGC